MPKVGNKCIKKMHENYEILVQLCNNTYSDSNIKTPKIILLRNFSFSVDKLAKFHYQPAFTSEVTQ